MFEAALNVIIVAGMVFSIAIAALLFLFFMVI